MAAEHQDPYSLKIEELTERIRLALEEFTRQEMVITSGDLPYRLALRLRKVELPERRAVEVLTAHQSTSTSGCICGGVGLGESHPQHIWHELQAAGLVQREQLDTDIAEDFSTRVDGVDYSPEGIEGVRQELIKYRKISNDIFVDGTERSVVLSHAIVFLARLKEIVEKRVRLCRRCHGSGEDAEGNAGRCAMCTGTGLFKDLIKEGEEGNGS